MTNLIAPHGGYKNLKSFQTAEIVFDLTAEFCKLYVDKTYRTNRTDTTNKSNTSYTSNTSNTSNKSYSSYSHNRQADQMLQAARSGKQNIAEGSQTSGSSKQSEIRLMDVARASLEELLNDYKDFLRTQKLQQWAKNDPRAFAIRKLAYVSNRSDMTYMFYMSDPESAANCLICLINQANFLLDQQLRVLEKDFKDSGDFKDRYKDMYKKEIAGRTDDDDEFLKSVGLRRLETGRVVGLNDPDQ